jgi:membrane-bound inhibitor of C-type lysozyme
MRSCFILFSIVIASIFGCSEASAQSRVNVSFRRGATQGTYNGSVKGAGYVDYLVRADVSQSMTVKLTRRSGDYPYFNILLNGSEEAIADNAREVAEWTGELPSTGVYAIRVYMAKAGRLAGRTSNFRISISVKNNSSASSGTGARTVYYDCDGSQLRADFKPGTPPTVRLRYGTQDFELPLEPSGSGSKYEFNNQMFWVKGNIATLESKVYNSQCKAKP